ncbi:MAG: protein kinase [Deltaproteobacteria bacterium]|nr:protein kinase [Deltaproteobacteria bacterium]
MRQPGTRIGPWQLVRPLGEGPFGVVWLAQDPDRQAVVLKLLREAFVQRHAGQAAFSRLISSIRIHEQLRHENLVEVYGPVQEPMEQALGVAMQFLEGRMLSAVQLPPAAREGKDARSLAVLLGWFEELGNAMAWLHAQGIIHGNLKPSNVMLVRHGTGHQVKVLDTAWSAIGLAAPSAGVQSFLAPEQLRGATPTPASDQWSMATLLSQILVGGPKPLTLGTLPAVLVLAVQRATQENPAQRFPRIEDLVGALHAIKNELLRGEGQSLRPERMTPRLGAAMAQGFYDEPATQKTTQPRPPPTPVPSRRPGPASDLRAEVPNPPMPRSVAFTESGGDLPAHRDPVPVPQARAIESTKESSGDLPYGSDGPAPGAFSHTTEEGPSFGLDGVDVADHGPSFGPSTSTPELEDGPTSVRAKSSQPYLLYGGLLMFVAGIVVVAALKFRNPSEPESTVELRGPVDPPAKVVPPPPPVVSPPPTPPPPVEEPPPIEAGPPPSEPKPPKAVEEPKIPKEPKAPKDPTEPKDNGKKKDDGKAPDLDQAMAKLTRPAGDPPPPAAEEGLGPSELSVGCDEGDGDACLKIAALALKKGDSSAARGAFERACDFGRGSGCLDAGDLWARDNNEAGEAKAKKLYERACNQAVATGCHQLATWLSEGRAGPPNSSRAAELEAKACQLGRKSSCVAAADEKLPDDEPPPTKTSTRG